MITLPATVCIALPRRSPRSCVTPGAASGGHATVPPVTADLDGRVVLVTGAASGIGQATALEVRGRGGSVLALDRAADGLAETSRPGARRGRRGSRPRAGDVGDEDAVAEAVAQAVGAFGRLDGVVTCAGIFDGHDLQPIEDVTARHLPAHVLRVNLAGTFLAVKHAIPHLRREAGEPTAASSPSRRRRRSAATGSAPGYTASKGGVAAFTRLVAVQGGPNGDPGQLHLPGRRRTRRWPVTRGTVPRRRPGMQAQRAARSRRRGRGHRERRRRSSSPTTPATSPGRSSRSTEAPPPVTGSTVALVRAVPPAAADVVRRRSSSGRSRPRRPGSTRCG